MIRNSFYPSPSQKRLKEERRAKRRADRLAALQAAVAQAEDEANYVGTATQPEEKTIASQAKSFFMPKSKQGHYRRLSSVFPGNCENYIDAVQERADARRRR